MAIRFYLAPKQGDGLSPTTGFRPQTIPELGVVWRGMRYGRENMYLVAADVTNGQHNTIIANTAITAIPQNIDANITAGALTAVKNALEAMTFPAEWVTTAFTYRQVLSLVGKLCLFMQRFDGRQRRAFFEAGITLDTTLGELTTGQRAALLDAATSLGIDTSAATGSATIRQALHVLAQQLPSFTLANQVF